MSKAQSNELEENESTEDPILSNPTCKNEEKDMSTRVCYASGELQMHKLHVRASVYNVTKLNYKKTAIRKIEGKKRKRLKVNKCIATSRVKNLGKGLPD